jgi:SAM-dependent methyltransferase
VDWGTGHYEVTARHLRAAAEVTVAHLAPQVGEEVVDIGCGTGNATLLVAAAGVDVLGVDPSERLLAVAAHAAAAADLAVTFAEGHAADLPVADGAADAAVSAFGLVFAPDPVAAAAEVGRVLSPTGRLVFSAWRPIGAIAEQMGLLRRALQDVTGDAPAPPPFAWHDEAAVTGLLAPHGLSITVHDHRISWEAASPEAYADEQMEHHPVWVEARPVLEAAGRWSALRDAKVELYRAANEDPAAFRVTSDYVVVAATR